MHPSLIPAIRQQQRDLAKWERILKDDVYEQLVVIVQQQNDEIYEAAKALVHHSCKNCLDISGDSIPRGQDLVQIVLNILNDGWDA